MGDRKVESKRDIYKKLLAWKQDDSGKVMQMSGATRPTDSQKAYDNFQCLRKMGAVDIDYRAELAQALEKKYEGLG